MEIQDSVFSVAASVLSGQSLGKVIDRMYFSGRGGVDCRLHFRSIHDTYTVVTDSRVYYFKVYRYRLRTKSEILAEIEILLRLKRNNVRAVEPVMTGDGGYVVRFMAAEGERYGVLFAAAGVKPSNSVEETDETNRRLGRYIGSVHKAWDTDNSPVDRWNLDIDSFIEEPMQYIRKYHEWFPIDIEFLEAVAEKTKALAASLLTKDTSSWGICHGDFYRDNFRLDAGDNPVLFDFDFCGPGWRVYDISLYVNSFGFGWDRNGIKKRKRRTDAFLEGYRDIMPLTDGDFETLYLFVPFRRIFNIGTIYISMSNTWGNNWVRNNVLDDIQALKQWSDATGFLR